ncbi:MAG: methyltransferase domain-containing protein [Gaiellales bacterium]|nr:MAG: methyltransferase domain-containing protein [Gaiellales bacterium]
MLAPLPGEQVLEPGFGTGHSLEAIAAAVGEEGRVFGIELSPRMLGLAQERLEREGLALRAELSLGDAASLPFRDSKVDAVFMSFTLELFDTPEIPRVLGECRRVLRPGGRVCVVALSKAGPPRLMERLYEWGHLKWPALLDCRPIYVGHSLREAAFKVRESRLSTIWGLPVETVLAFKQETSKGE